MALIDNPQQEKRWKFKNTRGCLPPQRKVAYVVPALNNVCVEVKNTFLQIPTPHSPRRRRALSWSSPERYDQDEKDLVLQVDLGTPSFESTGGKDDVQIGDPAMLRQQSCGLDHVDKPTWHQLSVDGIPCEIPVEKLGDFGKDAGNLIDFGDFDELLSADGSNAKSVRTTWNRWNCAANDWKSPANEWKERAADRKTKKTCLMLRGLPFRFTEQAVANFVDDLCGPGLLAPERPVHMLKTPEGWPSGFAEVYLACDSNFQRVRNAIHLQVLGGRYIEVLSKSRGAAAHRTGSKTWTTFSHKRGDAGGNHSSSQSNHYGQLYNGGTGAYEVHEPRHGGPGYGKWYRHM